MLALIGADYYKLLLGLFIGCIAMLYRINKYLLGFLLIFSTLYTKGQGKNLPDLLHYTIDNGLPSNNVYSIHADKNGYLWFASEKGVVKYNGYNFKVFTTKDGLPINDVWRLEEDKYGRIWLFSHASQIGYIRDNEYKKTKGPLENFACQKITTFAMIGNDICMGARLDIDNEYAFIRIDTDDFVHRMYIDKLPTDVRMYMDRVGNTYVFKPMDKLGTIFTLYRLELNLNNTRLIKINDSIPVATFEGQIIEIVHDQMYAHLFKYPYLQHYDIEKNKNERIDLKQYGAADDELIYVAYNKMDSILVITTGGFYVLDSDFIFRYAEKFKDIVDIPIQFSERMTDVFGNTWYATTSEGVLCKPKSANFLKTNQRLAALKNTKCLGTIANGLSFWWSQIDKKLYGVNVFADTIAYTIKLTDNVRSVSVYDSSTILIGTYTDLYIYNYITGELRLMFDSNDFLVYADNKVEGGLGRQKEKVTQHIEGFWQGVFFCSKYKGRYYTSRSNSGVVRVDVMPDTFIVSGLTLTTRLSEYYYDSSHKKYWFYNTESIVYLNPENDKSVYFDKKFLKQLNINNIKLLRTDKFDNLFVQCENKIVLINLRTLAVKVMALNVNVSGAGMAIYKDRFILSGDFGLGSARINGPLSVGTFRFVPNFKNYYYSRFNNMAVTDAGNIILNTNNAVYTVSVNDLVLNKGLFSSEKDIIKLVLSTPKERVIKDYDTFYCDESTVSVQLDAINMFGKGDKVFKYKLSGNEWKSTSSGEIFIGNIKSDNYHLVKYSFADDLWATCVHSFYIYKQPYWWQTKTSKFIFWVCGIGLFLGLLALVVLITRYRVAQINEKKQKITELELRALYAQINPHFIFNSLSAALYFISKKKFDEAYTHVSKFSRLLRSYLKASQERYVTLAKDIEMLQNYIELQQIRFENKFDYVIDVENKIPADSIQIPSLLLQPLVENAINHGLFHDGKKGLLKISFYQGANNDELICVIDDNGVGRDKAREIKKNNSVQTDSYGNKLTKQLIDIFREYERMDIYLEYIDKKEPETGTIVQLTIKNLKYVT